MDMNGIETKHALTASKGPRNSSKLRSGTSEFHSLDRPPGPFDQYGPLYCTSEFPQYLPKLVPSELELCSRGSRIIASQLGPPARPKLEAAAVASGIGCAVTCMAGVSGETQREKHRDISDPGSPANLNVYAPISNTVSLRELIVRR